MRGGEVPTVRSLAALCEILDLEFYVGSRRDPAPVDEERLRLAVQTALRAMESSGSSLGHPEAARLLVAVYQLIGSEGEMNAARVHELVQLLIEGR